MMKATGVSSTDVATARNGLETLADELGWQYFDIPHKQPIYHYTSPDGLLGIVKDKGINLRFTRYDCVNDRSEGTDVLRCYALACRELFDSGAIDGSFFDKVRDIELDVSAVLSFNINRRLSLDDRAIETGGEYVPLRCEAYICCFSREGDSLPMWNYYSKKGISQGYNVGFDAGLTERENILLQSDAISMEMVSVIYNDDEKIGDIKRIIEAVYKMSCGETDGSGCRQLITDELKKRMFRFKSQFFAHEQEIRLVLYVPVEFPEACPETDRLRIKYTSQNGYLIPYVDILYKKELLSRITVGPLLEKEISIRTLETIKTNYCYGYEIVTSSVPIRF